MKIDLQCLTRVVGLSFLLVAAACGENGNKVDDRSEPTDIAELDDSDSSLSQAAAVTTNGIRFAEVFSDRMVLQRDRPVKVWGETGLTGTVTVTFGSVSQTGKAANGRWSVTLPAQSASNVGRDLVASIGDPRKSVTIRDVVVGDVFLCAGQSNMALKVISAVDGKTEPASPDNDLRMLSIPKPTDKGKLLDIMPWVAAASYKDISGFSAVCYFMGKRVRQHVRAEGLPVGLVETAFGGSFAEAWTDAETLRALKLLKKPSERARIQQRPTTLYNKMIKRIVGLQFAGVVWYQGEGNADRAGDYRALLNGMIKSWRATFAYEMPFFIVQLPSYVFKAPDNWMHLRAAQSRVAATTPKTSLIVTIDLPAVDYDPARKDFVVNPHAIHPRNKRPVGNRVGDSVLASLYGKETAGYPRATTVKRAANGVTVEFENCGDGLRQEKTFLGFDVQVGASGGFVNAVAERRGKCSLFVKDRKGRRVTAVRYAWRPYIPSANVRNSEGLPAEPFMKKVK